MRKRLAKLDRSFFLKKKRAKMYEYRWIVDIFLGMIIFVSACFLYTGIEMIVKERKNKDI